MTTPGGRPHDPSYPEHQLRPHINPATARDIYHTAAINLDPSPLPHPSPGETPTEVIEIVDREVHEPQLTINGLRQALVKLRLRSIDERRDRLEMSAEAHKAAADRVVHPGKLPDESQEDYQARQVRNYIEARPITKLQKNQHNRNSRRLRRNMRQAMQNFNHTQLYGNRQVGAAERGATGKLSPTLEPINDGIRIGSPEHRDRLRSERLSDTERQSEAGVFLQHQKNERIVDRRVRRAKRSAAGGDIPGKVIQSRLARANDRAERLTNRLSILQAEAEKKRLDKQARRRNPGR